MSIFLIFILIVMIISMIGMMIRSRIDLIKAKEESIYRKELAKQKGKELTEVNNSSPICSNIYAIFQLGTNNIYGYFYREEAANVACETECDDSWFVAKIIVN